MKSRSSEKSKLYLAPNVITIPNAVDGGLHGGRHQAPDRGSACDMDDGVRYDPGPGIWEWRGTAEASTPVIGPLCTLIFLQLIFLVIFEAGEFSASTSCLEILPSVGNAKVGEANGWACRAAHCTWGLSQKVTMRKWGAEKSLNGAGWKTL